MLNIARRGMARAAREVNDSQALGGLPPELLAEAFSHLPMSGRIRASHVCQRWREIGLDTATLWSSFDASRLPLELTTELFQRSKDTLLCVKFSSVASPRITALLAENMYRMRDLHSTLR